MASIQSIDLVNLQARLQPLPDDPANPLEAAPGFPLSGDLNSLDNETQTVLIDRAEKFRKKYPGLEPYQLSNSPDQKYISYKDVMAMHPVLSVRLAKRLLQNIRFFLQKRKDTKLSVKAYCYMANENEEDVQMILQELNEQPTANKTGTLPELPVTGVLSELDETTRAIVFARVRRFRKRYPHGEPRYKSPVPFRFYIYSKDVVALYYPNKSERSAQRLLALIRAAYGKPEFAEVTVKEYCAYLNENEDAVREFLNQLDEQTAQRKKPASRGRSAD